MKQLPAFVLALVCVLSLAGCGQPPNTAGENASAISSHPAREPYTYEAFCQMPADQLLDLFLQHGLVIPDELKATCTEEELPILFQRHFPLWHLGISPMSHTMYFDLARQTKAIYDRITT